MRLIIIVTVLFLSACNRGPGEGNDNPKIESEIINQSTEEVKVNLDSATTKDTLSN